MTEALAAGVRFFQYRNKSESRKKTYEQALPLAAAARQAGALFIVNDHADIAAAVEADGVHLGQDDLPPEAARRLLDKDCIIGFSTHTQRQAELAAKLPVDYIALGPVFPTKSKSDTSPVLSEEEQVRIIAASALPVVAIGGITIESAQKLWQRGFASVAAIAAFAENPSQAYKRMMSLAGG